MADNTGFSISSMLGNPTPTEIAALSAAISVWAQGVNSHQVDNVVDNSVDILGIVRSVNRSKANLPLKIGYFSSSSTHAWSLTHKVRSRY